MATQKFTDEQLNYFRLSSVITNDVPEGLRTVFKQLWNARYQATHDQWLDTANNATDFYNMESPRNQRRNASLLTIMANGNTNQWDCTCLFYALLFSDCLGPFLNTAVKKKVDDLRIIRNKQFAHNAHGRLTDVDFEHAMGKISAAFKTLGLDTRKVDEMKTQKSFPTDELSRIQKQLDDEKKRYAKFNSFCVLPPKPSHDTTDRVDEVMTINHEMEKLRNTKKNETTVIYLSGNPGCGKSETARQIGNNYFKNIPEETTQLKFVFTFNASSIDTLLQSYVDFAARLSCDEDSVTRFATSKDLSPEEKIQKLKSLINPKMQIYSWWLIIVDNVNDLKLVSKYLPQAGEKTGGDGQILVTTQDSQSIPLDSYTYHYPSLKSGMKEEDAIALLSQISGCPGDRDTLLKIASALDFQPLAMACAAVYMQRILNCTDQSAKWEKYLLKLQEGEREATEEAYQDTILTYHSTMTAAVRMALKKVVREDKVMMHALQFLSVIANEPILLKYVVQHVINCMPDKDQGLVAAKISLSSLVISSEDEEMSKVIRVHQVVYYVLQKLFKNDGTDILKLMSVFSDLNCLETPYNVTKAEIIATRSFVPHFVVVSRKLSLHLLDHSNLTDESLTAADCLFKAGSICFVQGYYNASKIFVELCLSIQQRAYNSGPEMTQGLNLNSTIQVMNTSHEDKQSDVEGKLTCNGNVSVALATTLKRLGSLYRILRDYKTAQIHLEVALVIEERMHKGDHPELVITLDILGCCLRELGQHEKAEAYLQRALEIQEKNCCKNDFLLADTLINLVLLYQSQGESEKAKTYFERVLEHEQTISDSESPQLSVTLHNLGWCLSKFKKEQIATTFYEKALKIEESVHHANHPLKVITLGNLGVSLRKLEKYEEAKSYFEKALAIIENGNDQNDPRLLDTLDDIGVCLIQLKEFDKAKAHYERMLSICDKENNENDSILATTLNNLGVCLIELRQYEKAKAYLERALSILEKGDDENDPNLANAVNAIGICLDYLGQRDEAKTYYERALSIYEKEDNETDPGLGHTLHNLGEFLVEEKEFEKAKTYLERAKSIFEKGNHPQLASTLNKLVVCLIELRQYEKAKANLERAMSIHEKGDDENDPRLANTLHKLGVCHIELRQYEKAKAYLERALSIREKGGDENDPRLANAVNGIGVCLDKLGQRDEAKIYYERALSIYEKGDNETDPGLGYTLRNLGALLVQEKEFEKAKTYLERAKTIFEKGNHPQLASTLDKLGVCVKEQRQYEKAKEDCPFAS